MRSYRSASLSISFQISSDAPCNGSRLSAQRWARSKLPKYCAAPACVLVRRPSGGSSRNRQVRSHGRTLQQPVAWLLRESRTTFGTSIIGHYSRRAMGFAVFPGRPKPLAVRSFLGRAIARANATPKHLICDKDSIFCCEAFKRWCRRKAIRPRYGAVGKHGSISVVERFIRTMKDEATRRILIPQSRTRFRAALGSFFVWYNEHRPHTTLHGKTPNEVYFRSRPANRRPCIEARKRWPRPARCAKPVTLIAGRAGDRFTLHVDFYDARRHLPVV